jgi:hypothetical protein
MGEIDSSDLLPTLQLLERDSTLGVRLRAGRAAKRLQARTSEAGPVEREAPDEDLSAA